MDGNTDNFRESSVPSFVEVWATPEWFADVDLISTPSVSKADGMI
jgi:hypothetical protein